MFTLTATALWLGAATIISAIVALITIRNARATTSIAHVIYDAEQEKRRI